MFCQTTAVLVALSASLTLELTSSRLLLRQDGAIAAAASLDLLVISSLIALRQAAGRRGVAGLADGAESTAGGDRSSGSLGLIDVDGLGDCLSAGCCTQGGALAASDTVGRVIGGAEHSRGIVRS